MAASARLPSFSVFVAFRRRQLTMKRGIVGLEAAIRFAEQASSLRFRNHDQLFIMDDRTREVVWRGGELVSPEAAPPAEIAVLLDAHPCASRGEAPPAESAVAAGDAEHPAPLDAEAPDDRKLEGCDQAAPDVVSEPPLGVPPERSIEARFERMARALGSARQAHQRCARILRERLVPRQATLAAGREIVERTARLREHAVRATESFERSIVNLEACIEELAASHRAFPLRRSE